MLNRLARTVGPIAYGGQSVEFLSLVNNARSQGAMLAEDEIDLVTNCGASMPCRRLRC